MAPRVSPQYLSELKLANTAPIYPCPDRLFSDTASRRHQAPVSEGECTGPHLLL